MERGIAGREADPGDPSHPSSRAMFAGRLVLAALAGALYALAYPPLFGGGIWGSLSGIGIVTLCLTVLMLSLEGQHGTRARAIGFAFGMALFGVGLTWLFEIFGPLSVVLWTVLAAFTALFAEMQSRATRRGMRGGWLIGFTVLNWGAWEFVRAEVFPLKFPWLTAGLAVGPNALLPWIGVYGTGLLVILAAVLWVRGMKRAAVIPPLILTISVLLLPSHLLPETNDPNTIRVGGLQLEVVSLTELLDKTRTLPEDIEYVVWPEYAVPYDLRKNPRDWDLVRSLCRERGITLTLGTQAKAEEGDAWRNIALTLDPDGTRGEHTKVHTVHFFDDGTPGTRSSVVETRHGKIGTPICFDCDYEGVVRRMTAAGAEVIMVPVMDAVSWTARQHEQHAELFRIRACENGRWMFVCASSGISQVIDPSGKVHVRLAALEQGPLDGVVARVTDTTVYTRIGWLVPWGVLALAVLFWLILLMPQSWTQGRLWNDGSRRKNE